MLQTMLGNNLASAATDKVSVVPVDEHPDELNDQPRLLDVQFRSLHTSKLPLDAPPRGALADVQVGNLEE